MECKALMDLCGGLPGVTYDYPFGEWTRCYRVGGKIFAHVMPGGCVGALTILFPEENIPREQVEPFALLRCTPEEADFWRGLYPQAVTRPYHSPQGQWPYCNTVLFLRDIPDEALGDMVHSAYRAIFARLPKRKQEEINRIK